MLVVRSGYLSFQGAYLTIVSVRRYWPAALSVVLLVAAVLAQWPSTFYSTLRLVVFATAAYLAVEMLFAKSAGWACAMGAAAYVFNPLFPVHLRRGGWQAVDVISALVFAVFIAANGGSEKKK